MRINLFYILILLSVSGVAGASYFAVDGLINQSLAETSPEYVASDNSGLLAAAAIEAVSPTIETASTGTPAAVQAGPAVKPPALPKKTTAVKTLKTTAVASAKNTTPPGVPSITSATVVSDTQINVVWGAPLNTTGLAGYNIYRDGKKIASVPAGTTKYANINLSPSTSYVYAVASYNNADTESAKSNTMRLITAMRLVAVIPAVATSTTPETAAPAAVSAPTPALAQAATPTPTLVPTPAPAPIPAPDTTPPSAPAGLSASAISSSQINLSWTASSDNTVVSGYRVYRNGNQIGSTSGTSYVSGNLSGGTAYSYTVAAFDAAGNLSAKSTAATATTRENVTPSRDRSDEENDDD